MPALEIAKAVRTVDAKLILLSATLTTQIRTLAESIKTVREVAEGAKILVGGLALQESPDLWRQLRADGYAPNVESAVDVGSKLVAEN